MKYVIQLIIHLPLLKYLMLLSIHVKIDTCIHCWWKFKNINDNFLGKQKWLSIVLKTLLISNVSWMSKEKCLDFL